MILLEMIRLKGESIIRIFSTDTKIIQYNIEAIATVSLNLARCTRLSKYVVLVVVSARTYMSVYAHLLW